MSWPELAERCATQWSLRLEDPYPDSSNSWVIRVVTSDGTPAVLKLSFPGEQVAREAAALRSFAGRGSVRLLAVDEAAGAMLLERADPGRPLAQLCETDDERATSIAAEIVRSIGCPAPADFKFPSVETWFPQRVAPPPELRDLASDAASIAADLIRSQPERLLLHGDLHQSNILAAGETWLAIDPKGVIGERACEIGPLLLNPISLLRRQGLPALIARRIGQLCDEVGLDRQRAQSWTFVRAVLAVLWCFEDHVEPPPEWLSCALLLRESMGPVSSRP